MAFNFTVFLFFIFSFTILHLIKRTYKFNKQDIYFSILGAYLYTYTVY